MSVTLILGDVHLGKGLGIGKQGIGSNLNSRVVDQLNILDWVHDTAVSRIAHDIIITGDIFEDPKPHPTIIALFISWLKKCTDSNIKVHIITGNHDVLRSGQFYMSALDIVTAAEIENVFVYNYIRTIHTNGASFTLMPFRDRRSFNVDSNAEAIKNIIGKMPYELSEIHLDHAKVVIGHLAIEGSIPVGDEIDDMTNELFCPLDMFAGYDYVWMGHVHKPQVLSKAPYISHIGSMDLSDFGETDHTKVLVSFDPASPQTFDYIEIPTRPLKQISITVPENISDVTAYVNNELKNNKGISKSIVKLNVNLLNPDLISMDRSLIESTINDMGAFHICRISEERKISPIVRKENSDNMDNTINEAVAVKMYSKILDEKIREDFISTANSIIKEFKEGVK